jgi:uncharacterized protein (AIM24 family)
MIAQKDALLVAEKSVNLSIALQRRLGAGLFGGEGFILQRFDGPGTFFAALDGEIVEYTLKPGQRLLVDTGHLAMFEPTVTYDIQVVKHPQHSVRRRRVVLCVAHWPGPYLVANHAADQASGRAAPVYASRRRKPRKPGDQPEARIKVLYNPSRGRVHLAQPGAPCPCSYNLFFDG